MKHTSEWENRAFAFFNMTHKMLDLKILLELFILEFILELLYTHTHTHWRSKVWGNSYLMKNTRNNY